MSEVIEKQLQATTLDFAIKLYATSRHLLILYSYLHATSLLSCKMIDNRFYGLQSSTSLVSILLFR